MMLMSIWLTKILMKFINHTIIEDTGQVKLSLLSAEAQIL